MGMNNRKMRVAYEDGAVKMKNRFSLQPRVLRHATTPVEAVDRCIKGGLDFNDVTIYPHKFVDDETETDLLNASIAWTDLATTLGYHLDLKIESGDVKGGLELYQTGFTIPPNMKQLSVIIRSDSLDAMLRSVYFSQTLHIDRRESLWYAIDALRFFHAYATSEIIPDFFNGTSDPVRIGANILLYSQGRDKRHSQGLN